MTKRSPLTSERKAALARTGFRVSIVMLAASLAAALYALLLSQQNQSRLALIGAYLLCVFCGMAASSALLSRRGLPRWGMRLIIASLLSLTPVATALISGVGLALGLIAIIATVTTAALTLPPRQIRWTLMAGFISGVGALLIDLYWPLNRIDPPLVFQRYVLPAVVLGVLAVFGVLVGRQFPRFTLRSKLTVGFMAVALLPLGLLAFLNNLTAQASLTEAANSALFSAASQTASALDAFFAEASGIVRAESLNPILRNYLVLPPDQRPGSEQEKTLKELLDIFVQKDSRILSYMLLDTDGQVVAASASLDVGTFRSDYDYFAVPLATGQSYRSPLDFSEGAVRGSLFFSYPVRDNFETIGVLVARYNAEFLQDMVADNNNRAGSQSYAIVLDEHHFRIAHGTQPDDLLKSLVPLPAETLAQLRAAHRVPDVPAAALATNLTELEKAMAQADARPGQAQFFAVLNGATGQVDQMAATRMTNAPWTVLFVQPQKVFLQPAILQTRNTILLGVLIAGVVTLAALVISQILTSPITRLTKVAARVSAGDPAARAQVEAEDEIGALAATFNTMTDQLRQTLAGLEGRVEERTAQLQAAADISRAATAMRDPDELLRLTLDLIRERFGFYHASIFLMDEAGEFAVLRESTGEVGAQLKARGHKLGVGSHSLVGWVAQNRRPRVAMDVAGDPYHFKNPLLPNTRSEASLPLVAGEQLLGVLNVQSTELNAFDEDRVRVLQTLADQLSVAIQNAQLFQRTQANLREMSALYQQVTETAWRSFLRQQPRELSFDLEPGAAQAPQPDGAPLALALRMGGEVVGAIELYGVSASRLGPEEQAVFDTLATQISVALESAALFQDTQHRRRREQLINEITYQMRSTLNPSAIVQSGIRELGRALGATEVVVRLQRPAPPAASPGGQEG